MLRVLQFNSRLQKASCMLGDLVCCYLCCGSYSTIIVSCNSRWSLWRLTITVNVGNTYIVIPLIFYWVSNSDWEIFSFSSWADKIFTTYLFLPFTEFPSSSFLYLFVIAQIYALITCLIPRLLEWRRQMSCFWLAPIHALRHHFLMLEFERGLYLLVMNKHADPSGFDTVVSSGASGNKLRACI